MTAATDAPSSRAAPAALRSTGEVTSPPRHADQDSGLPLTCLALLAAVAAGAKAQGGFYPAGQLLIGALVLVAALRGLRIGRPGWPVVAAGLLAGWSLLSAAIAGDVQDGASGAALVIGLHFSYTLVIGLGTTQRRTLVDGLLVVGAVLALLGMVGVALHRPPLGHLDSGVWRAATTLTYENAAAGLLVPLALVALALCHTHLRRAAAVLLLAGAGATLSRGGLLALLVGLVVLLALVDTAARRLLVWPLTGAVIAVLGLLPSVPETAPPRPFVAVAGLLLGLAVATGGPSVSGVTRRTALVVAAALLVGGVTFGNAALRNAGGELLDKRLTVAQGDRVEMIEAAAREWGDSPVTGVGPGQQWLRWQDGTTTKLDRYAHNEYLQVLWKTGLVGLGLLLIWLGRLLLPLLRSDRTALHAGCLAALAALATASALDFLWHLPLIPLVGVVLIGVATSAPAPPTSQEDL